MEFWDELVLDRNKEEKNAIRLQKLREKSSLSLNDINSRKRDSGVQSQQSKNSKIFDDSLFD